MDIVEQFVDKLMEERKLESQDTDFLTRVRADLVDRLQRRLNAALIEHLPPERLEEFDAMLAANPEDPKIQEFCKQHIPDLDIVMADAMLDFRSSYLGVGAQ